MSTSTLPKVKTGDTLPASASKIGELFSLNSGSAAGIYRVASLSPLSWVRETNGLAGAGFPIAQRTIFDAPVSLNTAGFQAVWTNTNSQAVAVISLFFDIGNVDINAFCALVGSYNLAVKPTTYPHEYGLWAVGKEAVCDSWFPDNTPLVVDMAQTGYPKRFLLRSGAQVVAQWLDDDNVPINPALAGNARLICQGFFID